MPARGRTARCPWTCRSSPCRARCRRRRRRDMRATWRLLAGHRDLRLVLGAGLVSMSGDWILLIGLLYRVYALTGSTVESALVMLSAAAPQVLLGAVAG